MCRWNWQGKSRKPFHAVLRFPLDRAMPARCVDCQTLDWRGGREWGDPPVFYHCFTPTLSGPRVPAASAAPRPYGKAPPPDF
jgi:hypothetical protein